MMSADLEEAVDMMCCASCGIAEVDDIKLKKCAACDLVQYCSDKCQQEHRPKHEAMCKERAAELRDEILFRQPESTHLGDCPICFLPLSIDTDKSMLTACCNKMICNGCAYANGMRQPKDRLEYTCPFCRYHYSAKTFEESKRNEMKRIEANDPAEIRRMGSKHYDDGDYSGAFECWTKAAGLGDIDAHFCLSILYRKGEGVEKNEKKQIYHLDEAAIAGHPRARISLACHEGKNNRSDRAVKHLMIAANLGYDKSLQVLRECYVHGEVSKGDFAAALCAHQAAKDEMKSPQREAAAKAEAAGKVWFEI